jgi:TonB family protein
MLLTQGKARVLAEPKLVAASRKTANAFLGVEVPVVSVTSVSSGTVSQNIEWKPTGVTLEFTPTMLSDQHSIQLAINADVSSIDKTVAITVSGVLVPGFKKRQTQTELVVDSGETVLISGLLQDEEKKNLSQLPGVGNIPVLGTLFRSTEFTRGRTELVIMVTPELTLDAGMAEDRSFVLEQALASAEVSGAVNDPILRYALQIQDRIAKAIRYPLREKELGMGGRVKLRLHLFRDGTLGRAMVSEPSGVEVFDLEAMKAAESQSPYPPFPSDLMQQELWVELPVLFRQN